MILKEFRCDEHGDFTSGLGICPRCGEISRRVFTAPCRISSGRSKRIDAVIEGEFRRRGISNYTNATGTPRVDYGTGEYNGVRAGWGKQHLQTVQRDFAHMMPPGAALSPPPLPGGSNDIDPEIPSNIKNAQPWSRSVPTEVMDLKPNE